MVMVGGRDPRRMMCWCYMVRGENGRWRSDSEVDGIRPREEKRSKASEGRRWCVESAWRSGVCSRGTPCDIMWCGVALSLRVPVICPRR